MHPDGSVDAIGPIYVKYRNGIFNPVPPLLRCSHRNDPENGQVESKSRRRMRTTAIQ
jgi:hypothetical protein